MEPEPSCESTPLVEPAPSVEGTASQHPLVNSVAKLMGQTAGLAQSAGVKTAGGLLTAARHAGKLLAVPAKLPSLVVRETSRKRKARLHRDIEHLRLRMQDLYARIGEGLCNSSYITERTFLAADPQVAALVALVRDLEAESRELQAHLQCPSAGSLKQAQAGTTSVPPEARGPGSEANAAGPSPATEGPAEAAPGAQ